MAEVKAQGKTEVKAEKGPPPGGAELLALERGRFRVEKAGRSVRKLRDAREKAAVEAW
jgi:hypothetical protein